MDTIQENVEDLVTHVMDYMDTQKELLMLSAREKTAQVLSTAAAWAFLGLFILFAFAMFSIGLSIWLGLLFNSLIAGFLITGTVYILLATIVFVLRKSLFQRRLGHYLTAKLTQEDEQ